MKNETIKNYLFMFCVLTCTEQVKIENKMIYAIVFQFFKFGY